MPVFVTSDGHHVEVPPGVFPITRDFEDGVLPLQNISKKILLNVLSLEPVPADELIDTCRAADFLGHQEALDRHAKAIADSLKGMTASEIRRAYGGVIGDAIDARKKCNV